MTEPLTGWALLLSPIDEKYKKPIHESVYRKKGLTDVNDGYLWSRLYHSGFPFSVDVMESRYLGTQERKGKNGPYMVHCATAIVKVTLWDEGRDKLPRTFTGAGAHENMSYDACVKGAATSAMGQAYKYMGQTMQLYLDGQINDLIYAVEQAESDVATGTAAPPPADVEVPELTAEQMDVLRILLGKLDTGEQQTKAKTFAWERMKQAAVRKQDHFEAGYKALVAVHERLHGPDCEHVRTAQQAQPSLFPPKAA